MVILFIKNIVINIQYARTALYTAEICYCAVFLYTIYTEKIIIHCS